MKCEIAVDFNPIVEIDENNNWFAYCDGLQSVFSTGATKDEALEGLIECIKTYLNISLNHGYKIPQNENFSYTIFTDQVEPKFVFNMPIQEKTNLAHV